MYQTKYLQEQQISLLNIMITIKSPGKMLLKRYLMQEKTLLSHLNQDLTMNILCGN